MKSEIKRTVGNTVELTISIAWSEIQKSYAEIFAALLKEIELPGFRKGKVPEDLAKKHVDSTRVYEEVLKKLVPDLYAKVIKEYNLRPIISPKVEVLEAAEKSDWKLRITTCEKPKIVLGDYRKGIRSFQESKKSQIWTPGDTKEKPTQKEPTLDEILDVIEKTVNVELSPILEEQEVNRFLSNLINETQKLGITVEQYLQSQGKTQETLRSEYTVRARKTLILEFALEEIAEAEKIVIEPQEVEAIVKNAKTEVEKQALESQRYYIASLLRRQKTLTALMKPTVVTA